MGGPDIAGESVTVVTFSPEYWQKLDQAFQEPEQYIELSKAASLITDNNALNAKIEDGETVYEE
ncbi:MAG: hypothetical protein ABEK02_08410, partial [Haloquadratum sp.]